MQVEKCCLDCKFQPDLDANMRMCMCANWLGGKDPCTDWGLGFIGPKARPFINCDDWVKIEEKDKCF